jgi:putative FmdB family regulatory protein
MPLYEFDCSTCRKEIALTLSVKAREAGAKCPDCQRPLEPLLATFYSKTSRKS